MPDGNLAGLGDAEISTTLLHDAVYWFDRLEFGCVGRTIV